MDTLTDQCPYCRRQYVYAGRLIIHVQKEHKELYKHFARNYTFPHDNDTGVAAKRQRMDSEDSETAPIDSDEEYDSDSSTDDRDDLNPRYGDLFARQEKTQTCAGKTYDVEPELQNDSNDTDNPWGPFVCAEDYHFGRWFVEHQISQAAIKDYFNLAKRFPHAFYRGSFTSSYTLFKTIDKMTHEVGWDCWKSGKVRQRLPEDLEGIERDNTDPRDDAYATFFYRNPLSCITFLMRQERLVDDFIYEPYKDFNEKGHRVYGDMHTANWWWDAQHKVPNGSTILPVICASDQTHLTNFSGDKKMWPLYLTLGNIPWRLRNKPSNLYNVLLALLPIPPKLSITGKGKTNKEERQRVLSREVLRTIMHKVLKPLTDIWKEGKFLLCPDRAVRKCFPIVCAWIADHVENVVLHSVKTTACVACEIPRSLFGSLLHPPLVLPELRKGSKYLELLLQYETKGDDASLAALKFVDVKAMEGCFWALDGNGVSLETLPKPDLLHTIYLGMFKHLMEWLTKFLEAHNRMALFNKIWRLSGPYPGHHAFNKEYTATKQWNGHEMRSLGRILLPIVGAALRNPSSQHRRQFDNAVSCVRYFVYFHLLLQYKSHTDETVSLMRHYLNKFYILKDVFIPYRAGKATKAQAASLRTTLTKERAAHRLADQTQKRTSAAQEKRQSAAEKKIVDEQVSELLKKETKFDFVKMHYLEHFIEHVLLFGNVQAFSSETLETLHGQLKDGYRSSNKVEATRQVLTNIARIDAFRVDQLRIQHKEDQKRHLHAIPEPPSPKPRRLKGKVTKFRDDPKRAIRTVKDVAEDYGFEHSEFTEQLEAALSKIREPGLPFRRTANSEEDLPLLNWPATPYLTVSIPVLEHQEVENETLMPVRCTGKRRWRTIYPPRNDFVFVWMGNPKLYGALGGRLPAKLSCLMKVRDPTTGKSYRLALLSSFEVENGGAVKEPHGLVTVRKKLDQNTRRTKEGAGSTFVVPISRLLGPAHLIPIQPVETRQWFVNSTIDLAVFNSIY